MLHAINLLPKATVELLKDQSVSGIPIMESYENVLFALDAEGGITTYPRELLPYLDVVNKIFIVTDDSPHTTFYFSLMVYFGDNNVSGQVLMQGNIFYLTESLFKTIHMWSTLTNTHQLLQTLVRKLALANIPFNDSYPSVKIEL